MKNIRFEDLSVGDVLDFGSGKRLFVDGLSSGGASLRSAHTRSKPIMFSKQDIQRSFDRKEAVLLSRRKKVTREGEEWAIYIAGSESTSDAGDEEWASGYNSRADVEADLQQCFDRLEKSALSWVDSEDESTFSSGWLEPNSPSNSGYDPTKGEGFRFETVGYVGLYNEETGYDSNPAYINIGYYTSDPNAPLRSTRKMKRNPRQRIIARTRRAMTANDVQVGDTLIYDGLDINNEKWGTAWDRLYPNDGYTNPDEGHHTTRVTGKDDTYVYTINSKGQTGFLRLDTLDWAFETGEMTVSPMGTEDILGRGRKPLNRKKQAMKQAVVAGRRMGKTQLGYASTKRGMSIKRPLPRHKTTRSVFYDDGLIQLDYQGDTITMSKSADQDPNMLAEIEGMGEMEILSYIQDNGLNGQNGEWLVFDTSGSVYVLLNNNQGYGAWAVSDYSEILRPVIDGTKTVTLTKLDPEYDYPNATLEDAMNEILGSDIFTPDETLSRSRRLRPTSKRRLPVPSLANIRKAKEMMKGKSKSKRNDFLYTTGRDLPVDYIDFFWGNPESITYEPTGQNYGKYIAGGSGDTWKLDTFQGNSIVDTQVFSDPEEMRVAMKAIAPVWRELYWDGFIPSRKKPVRQPNRRKVTPAKGQTVRRLPSGRMLVVSGVKTYKRTYSLTENTALDLINLVLGGLADEGEILDYANLYDEFSKHVPMYFEGWDTQVTIGDVLSGMMNLGYLEMSDVAGGYEFTEKALLHPNGDYYVEDNGKVAHS